MPIAPWNKHRYPADWKEIRARIIARANNCCEGSPEYRDCRAKNGEPHPVTMSKVVLTIAHLDHVPENCSDDNLRAWCQRCHLNYDRKNHIANREKFRQYRAEQAGQEKLFKN